MRHGFAGEVHDAVDTVQCCGIKRTVSGVPAEPLNGNAFPFPDAAGAPPKQPDFGLGPVLGQPVEQGAPHEPGGARDEHTPRKSNGGMAFVHDVRTPAWGQRFSE